MASADLVLGLVVFALTWVKGAESWVEKRVAKGPSAGEAAVVVDMAWSLACAEGFLASGRQVHQAFSRTFDQVEDLGQGCYDLVA